MRGAGHPIVPGGSKLALARKRVAPVLNAVAFDLASPALIVSVTTVTRPSLHQPCQHLALETMRQHQRFRSAVLIARRVALARAPR
jgi:hypothetical protein